jgi:sigma54-dependent transcription regulator
MIESLNKKEVLIARRFADENNYPIEFVHECFAVLNPYFNSSTQEFEKDVIDELYEFPIEIKESSQIFLSLGRRDIKLEYKHKVLTL